jgi:alanine-glyoxylate transaminase/serine-glyoxylate transaminase/serine-pyruvate transaminase
MLTAATKRVEAPPRLLFGPGPSGVDPRAYEAMAQPVLGIRDPYFLRVMSEIRSGLRSVFGTTNEKTFTVPASGSGAMETAVVNFIRPGSKFAVFAAGHFANRIALMGARQGATVVKLEKPWGEVFTAEEAEEFFQQGTAGRGELRPSRDVDRSVPNRPGDCPGSKGRRCLAHRGYRHKSRSNAR